MVNKKTPLPQKINTLRRKLVHSAWVTPTILSVNLPAHAQMSEEQEESSCSIELSSDSIFVVSVPNNFEVIPPLEVTITNTGNVPISTDSDLLGPGINGLSFTTTNENEIGGELMISDLEFNGTVPNPLQPNQSSTFQITRLVNACGFNPQDDPIPIRGTLDLRFSRNGSNECLASVSVMCDPVP